MRGDINKVLEIHVITYNRAQQLIRTLNELKSSVFSHCEVTIHDNCSTDDSELLFQQNFFGCKLFTYSKNIVNIGGSGNLIQAFLASKKIYTWIICDDDYFNFDSTSDIEYELNLQSADLIQVGGHAFEKANRIGTKAPPKVLIEEGHNFFRDGSFLPSTIYRTSLVHQYLWQCYSYSYFMYPHMAIIMAAYENDSIVYVSKINIVTPSIGTQSYTRGEHLESWFLLSEQCSNSSMRSQMLASQWTDPFDTTGIIRLIFTAIKFKKYSIAVKVILFYNLKILKSFHSVVVNYKKNTFKKRGSQSSRL